MLYITFSVYFYNSKYLVRLKHVLHLTLSNCQKWALIDSYFTVFSVSQYWLCVDLIQYTYCWTVFFCMNFMWSVVLLECDRMLEPVVSKIFQDHSSKSEGICKLINEVRSARSLMGKKVGRKAYVHSVEQKSIGTIFHTSRSGSAVRYSCHHNLSRITFPIFAQSWRFSVFHSLQSITTRIY